MGHPESGAEFTGYSYYGHLFVTEDGLHCVSEPDMKQLIFVVEEEAGVRALARQCLEEAGYAVRTFSTTAVITDAEESRPALMLIAMVMPDGTGLELCRTIRGSRALARMPLVFLIPQAAEEHR